MFYPNSLKPLAQCVRRLISSCSLGIHDLFFFWVERSLTALPCAKGREAFAVHKIFTIFQSFESGCSPFFSKHKNLEAPSTARVLEVLQKGDPKQILDTVRAGISSSLLFEAWPVFVLGKGWREKEWEMKEHFDELWALFGSKRPSSILPPLYVPDFGHPLRWDTGSPPFSPQVTSDTQGILCILKEELPDVSFCPFLVSLIPLLLQAGIPAHVTHGMCLAMVRQSQRNEMWFPLTSNSFSRHVLTFALTCRTQVPKLMEHMVSLGLHPARLFQSWYARLYVDMLASSTLQRVMDIFLLKGSSILFSVAVGLLTAYQAILLRARTPKQFLHNLSLLMKLDDPDGLQEAALTFSLTGKKILSLNASHRPLRYLPKPRIEIFHLPRFDPKTSNLITIQDMLWVYSWLPSNFRIYDPVLLYAAAKHGYKLSTLLDKVGTKPHVMVVKSKEGVVVGVFMADGWSERSRSSSNLGHFLFQLTSPSPRPGVPRGGHVIWRPVHSSNSKHEATHQPLAHNPDGRGSPRAAGLKKHRASSFSEANTTNSATRTDSANSNQGKSETDTPMKRKKTRSASVTPQRTMHPHATPQATPTRREASGNATPTRREASGSAGYGSGDDFQEDLVSRLQHHQDAREKLSKVLAFSLIRSQQTKVLKNNLSVIEAGALLVQNKLHSLPVVDAKSLKYLATINLAEVVGFLLGKVPPTYMDAVYTSINEIPPAMDKVLLGIGESTKKDGVSEIHGSDPFQPPHRLATLEELVHWFASGAERAPILDDEDRTLGIISKTDITYWMMEHRTAPSMQILLSVTVAQFQEAHDVSWEYVTVLETESVLKAIHMLNDKAITGVAVVDDKGVLKANFSNSDAMEILSTPSLWKMLFVTVKTYLTSHSRKSLEVVICKPTATLESVIVALHHHKISRVWLVDDEKKPVGHVSHSDLVDLLRWVLESAQEQEDERDFVMRDGLLARRKNRTKAAEKKDEDMEVQLVRTDDMISIGDCDNAALVIDKQLKSGSTLSTELFANPPLCPVKGVDGRFEVLEVECWGFFNPNDDE
eukprot:g71911.t1